MKESKLTKKTHKNEQILRTIKSYEYLLYGIIAHIYILFLICLSTELDIIYHDFILNYAVIASLVILLISRSMRWTWPIFIEETLIVILLWILLSSLLGAFHSLCAEHNETMALTIEELGLCDLTLFNMIYSFICLLLVLSAFFIDIRPYFISCLFRFIGLLCLLLIIILPSSCNRFQWIHPNELIIKITLYNIIWYYNSQRRNTENALFSIYKLTTLGMQHTIASAGYQLNVQQQQRRHINQRKVKELPLNHPAILFDRIQQISRYIEEYIEPDLRNESQDKMTENKLLLQKQYNVFIDLVHLNQQYYSNTYLFFILSWKNQSYTKQLIYIIDIARTVWILIICPFYLPLVIIELIWTLWYIRQNVIELRDLRAITKLFYIYKERKGNFSDYI